MRPSISSMLGCTALATSLLAACSDAPTSSSRPTPSPATLDRATPTFVYSSIDVAGADNTQPMGINSAGAIAGSYNVGSAHHGYIQTHDGVTTIDYTDDQGKTADYTDVRAIAPNGDIVGNFASFTEEAVAYHGFKRTAAGQFSTVHYPGHLYEILERILPDGTILGCRHDHNLGASMKGIMITSTGATEITAMNSMINGATPDLSLITGQFLNTVTNRTEAFVIENGVFSALVPFANVKSTVAWDVSPRGDIVGVYRDNAGAFHGFVRTEAGFTTLDANIPGVTVTATRAFGTNSRGDIVGTYEADGKTHGFLATRVR